MFETELGILTFVSSSSISSLWETFNRFIEAWRTSREQVRNEGRYSIRRSPIRVRYKGSHVSRSPNRHHDHRQRFEFTVSLTLSQSDTDDGSESDFVYHNPPSVTENQSKVREASSNVQDWGVDEETLDIFSEINSNSLVLNKYMSSHIRPVGWDGKTKLGGRVSQIPGEK